MLRITLWIMLLAILLGACSPTGPSPQSTPTHTVPVAPTATQTPSPTPEPPTATPTQTAIPSPTATATPSFPQDVGPNFTGNINPLTGLSISDTITDTLLDHRPVAVKIQSIPRTQRLNWSLSKADIVFDYYQNNGITRLNAIFYGNAPEKIGPVRSARYFDDYIIRMFETNFAFGGAFELIYSRLISSEYANRLVIEGPNSCPALCRDDPNGFNYLVANALEVGPYVEKKGADDTRQDLNGLTFKFQPPENGKPGENLFVRYSISSYVNWQYDSTEEKYIRLWDAQEAYTIEEEKYEEFNDQVFNERIVADNVIILKAPHIITRIGQGEVVDILPAGRSTAYAFRDGKFYDKIFWQPGSNGMVNLSFEDGTAYPLKHGTTWVQVVGENSTFEEQPDGSIRFEFRIP